MVAHLLHYSDVETALDQPRQCGALVGTLDALGREDTVLVGSGDNTAPGALSLETRGHIALSFYDAVGPDVETFGNHDFDFGIENARDIARASPQEWLCANARVDGDRFAADVTASSTMVEAGDERVGVVGVAHPKTGVMNPAAEGIEFEDPVPHVRREADRLREAGADHVVVASHCGRDDERLARETDVEAILGGHAHDVYENVVDGTALVRPGRAGRYVSEVVVGDGTARTTIHQVDDGHVDHEMAELVRERREEHGVNEVVTTVETPIQRTEEAVTTAGSRVGNLVADALRWKAGTDVALSPPGGIRSGEPLEGEVVVADIVGLCPYDDDLTTVELSGERLRDAFVAVPAGYHDDDSPDRHCTHVSGAHLVWDDGAGELLEATVGGEPVDPDATYTLAVDEYMIDTSHVNDVFDKRDVVARHGLGRDAILEFAREVGFDGGFERRVERPALQTDAER